MKANLNLITYIRSYKIQIFVLITLCIFLTNACFQEILVIDKNISSRDQFLLSVNKSIIRAKADGSSYETILNSAQNIGVISISPNNKHIIYYAYTGNVLFYMLKIKRYQRDIFLLDSKDKNNRLIYSGAPFSTVAYYSGRMLTRLPLEPEWLDNDNVIITSDNYINIYNIQNGTITFALGLKEGLAGIKYIKDLNKFIFSDTVNLFVADNASENNKTYSIINRRNITSYKKKFFFYMPISTLDVNSENKIIYAKGDKLYLTDINSGNGEQIYFSTGRIIKVKFVYKDKILLLTGKFEKESSLSGLTGTGSIESGISILYILDLHTKKIKKLFEKDIEPSLIQFSVSESKNLIFSTPSGIFYIDLKKKEKNIYKYSINGTNPVWFNYKKNF